MRSLRHVARDTGGGAQISGTPWRWLPLAVLAYVLCLVWMDREIGLLEQARAHTPVILACLLPVTLSFLLRYQRWRYLLAAQGARLPWGRGLLAYLTGFALTVSPGKAGELLRIRYHRPFAIPPPMVIRAFVCERSVDLLVLLALALWAAGHFAAFQWLALAVLALLGVLALLAIADRPRGMLRSWIERRGEHGVWGAASSLVEASDALRLLASPGSMLLCSALGMLAWLSTTASFVLLCSALGFDLPPALAWGLYPLAMLMGAASGVPGGVGTTEAAIVLLLTGAGHPLETALVVAVLCRGVTLWYAVLLGLASVAMLEWSLGPASHREAS